MIPKIEKNFYEKVEDDNFLTHVLYSDTDSCYIKISDKIPDNIFETIKLVHSTAGKINDLIKSYVMNYSMPRCGYDSSHNQTSFKEEIIIDAMIFSDIKKAYAYRQLTSEAVVDENNKLIKGQIFKEGKIKTKSNMGVKTNDARITKTILDSFISTLLTDKTKEEKRKILNQIVGEQLKIFKERSSTFDFEYVGLPAKWRDNAHIISSMKFYNAICGNEFQYGTSGYFYYINIRNLDKIKKLDLDIKKIENLNGISVPYKFNPELLKEKMEEYQFSLNVDLQWGTVYNTTCNRLYELVKNNGKN